MRRRTRANLLLLGVVALLGAVAVAVVQREQRPPPGLSELDLAGVRSIAVECGACQSRRFEREQGRWWMREPYQWPADAAAVERLLRLARAPVRPLDGAALDPAKLGLAPAQATLILDQQPFQFGGIEPIDGQRYVSSGAMIALMPDRFSGFLYAPPESELDHHLLVPGSVPSAGNAAGVALDAATLARWQRAAAGQVIRHVSDGAERGIQVALTLTDASTLHFLFLRQGAGYLAVRADVPIGYALEASAALALLGQ